jgi:hypothetical protein
MQIEIYMDKTAEVGVLLLSSANPLLGGLSKIGGLAGCMWLAD